MREVKPMKFLTMKTLHEARSELKSKFAHIALESETVQMLASVGLFAAFRDGRGKTVNVDWYDGITGTVIIELLGISPSAVAIYLINGKNSDPKAALSETDIVFLFPPVGGG